MINPIAPSSSIITIVRTIFDVAARLAMEPKILLDLDMLLSIVCKSSPTFSRVLLCSSRSTRMSAPTRSESAAMPRACLSLAVVSSEISWF